MPCLTDNQIDQIRDISQAVHNFLEQHVDVESGASRFWELDAFFADDLLGGLISYGRVAADQNSIALGRVHLQNLSTISSILNQATPDTNTTEPSGDQCQDLIDAINNINLDWSGISSFLSVELNNFAPILVNQIRNTFRLELQPLISVNQGIIDIIGDISNEVSRTSNILVDINSTLVSRTTEILERIHDFRVELRQTAERVIQVWDCLHTEESTVDAPTCKPSEIDLDSLSISIVEGVSVFLNPLLNIEQSLRLHIANELSVFVENLNASINSCCSSLELMIKQENIILAAQISSPTWLLGVTSKLNVLVENSQGELARIIAIQNRLTILQDSLESLSQITNEGDIINHSYSNTTNYYTDNNELIDSEDIDTTVILAALSSIREITEQISQCVCLEISGNLSLSKCYEEGSLSFPYQGRGLAALHNQLKATASIIDVVGKRTCDSSNTAIILPSDKFSQLPCYRQLILYFGLNFPYFTGSTWRIYLPAPRPDLTWNDFDGLTWKKGNYTHSIIFSFDGGQTYSRKNATWGAFSTRQHGIEFFDYVLTLLEPDVASNAKRSNGDGKITKRNPNATIRCVRAFVIQINNKTGEKESLQCYAPPR